jgi:octaprenyl-diphosphate synthase
LHFDRQGTPLDATRIFDMVGPDLEKVQARIQDCLTSHVGIVDHLGRYVGENTGKKLRPALLVLAGRMVKAPEESLPVLGALVELLHTASLVHDDIIDEAATRRGRPSVNAAFGNQKSVLLGDWMYMTAFQVAVNQKSFAILDLLLDVTRKMVEGELIQLELLDKVETTAAESLDIAARKTAHLFSASTALPGLAASRPQDEQDRLTRIGLNLGLAFQLVDDILDYTADERKLGKPIMNDLREGKLTLPVIHLLEGGDPEHRRMVETVLAERDFRTVPPAAFLAALESRDCLARTMATAHGYSAAAREDLRAFAPSVERDALASLAEFILARRH